MFNSANYNNDLHQVLNTAFTEISNKYKIVLHEQKEEEHLLSKLYQLIGNQPSGLGTISELKYYCSFGFQTTNPFKIIIFEKTDSYYHGRSAQRLEFIDYIIIAYKRLSVNYDEILIRKETFNDKLIDLIFPQEIDIDEFPEFSKKYFVLAKNENTVNQFINKSRANLLVENSDMDVIYQIHENDCWIVNLKDLCTAEIIKTINIISRI